MRTVSVKVPDDVAGRLRRISGYTVYLRAAARRLAEQETDGQSAYDKSADLCGCLNAGGMARGRVYLKQYAKRNAD